MSEFYLSTDCSGHWYVVPEERRGDWEEWSNIDEDDERAWAVPDYATRVNGSPSRVVFSGWRIP